jgi:hypothetical protein
MRLSLIIISVLAAVMALANPIPNEESKSDDFHFCKDNGDCSWVSPCTSLKEESNS